MIKIAQKVIYEKNMMPSIRECIEIDVENNKICYIKNDNKIEKENISNELITNYLEQLFRITNGWKKEYINQDFFDGIEWRLTIIYRDGEKTEYIGKNKFPYNFVYLDKIEYQMINKIMENK